jgi:hypothetical protein
MKLYSKKAVVKALCFVCLGSSTLAFADGRVVDKVYHPYVQPL